MRPVSSGLGQGSAERPREQQTRRLYGVSALLTYSSKATMALWIDERGLATYREYKECRGHVNAYSRKNWEGTSALRC